MYFKVPNDTYDNTNIQTFKSLSGHTVKYVQYSKMTPASAQNKINTRSQQIEKLYEPFTIPYSGEIHSAKDCQNAESFKHNSAENDVSIYKYIDLKTNSDMILGVCNSKQPLINLNLIFLYCKNESKLYEIRIYSKNNLNPMNIVSCLQ